MLRAALRCSLLLLPIALLEIACSRPPEQQMLNQFFRAEKTRDNTTAALMSTVSLDPRTQGAIEDFSITSVGIDVVASHPFIRIPGSDDPVVAALLETSVSELLAAELWRRHPI